MAPTCNWMIKIVKVYKLYLNSLLVSIVNRVSRSGTQVALAPAVHKESLSCERWKRRNGQLAKMRPFHQSKRSDNKRHNSYNSAMTVIAQDDHLTAGAWAACERNNEISMWKRRCVKQEMATYITKGRQSLSCSARSFSDMPAIKKSSAAKLRWQNSFNQFRRTTKDWSHSCICVFHRRQEWLQPMCILICFRSG